MKFCPTCSNLLVPKKKMLFCQACNEHFELKHREEYKIIKKIKHDEREGAPIIIKESYRGERISGEDRKAFEEYFGSSEANSY